MVTARCLVFCLQPSRQRQVTLLHGGPCKHVTLFLTTTPVFLSKVLHFLYKWKQKKYTTVYLLSGLMTSFLIPSIINSSSSDSPLYTSITPCLFHSRLKTYLFHKSYSRSFTSSSRTASTGLWVDRFFWATRFLFFVFSFFVVSVPCARLSWPSRQLLSAC